jgi:spore coat protein A
VTHLHGAFVTPQSDGQPEAWVTPRGVRGPHFATLEGAGPSEFIFAYPSDQRATMLWYHDHAMALTRLNIYAGLAGVYLIRDPHEHALALPRGDYEIPLIVQDRIFNSDGSLHYPSKGDTAYHPQWVPEFFGHVPVVNGKAYPYLDVQPRRYRLRILNASNSRFYRLAFRSSRGNEPFWLIGVDQGFRAAPLWSTSVTLAPAERADVIIDLAGMPQGTKITMTNDAPAPYPGGGEPGLPEIMRFHVSRPLSGADRTTRPDALTLPSTPRLRPSRETPRREFVLTEITDRADKPVRTMINQQFFFEPVEDSVRACATEIWEYVNTTAETHPMHVHLLKFQVLDRQRVDDAAYLDAFDRWIAGGRRPGDKPQLADYLRRRAHPARA